ncbi:hypothetical protein PGT21_029690 [Puccinia graminis f. sp. tritici]|uniref:Uncharacterized protein n=1 Tax=Puccinia graminis f. sp. tritici TaxID=56615 RepID=A0A5B0Q4L5_PUCGR|nr:hypothetical protein PGT21_029690 [Puccinia graminis f. sp. tritici]KAA1108033.1 hypothetical protein PGTUg99_025136 [Puccinia graminis f. sp. tritici]
MIPTTILFGIFMAFIPAATAVGVKCAREGCKYRAYPTYPLNQDKYPPEGPCGGYLGNNMYCQNNRLKMYYDCKCGYMTVKNKINQEGKEPECAHKGKRLASTPSNSPPPVEASPSGASEASSSAREIPCKTINGYQYFEFL